MIAYTHATVNSGIKTQDLKKCPTCESSEMRFWLAATDSQQGVTQQEFKYFRCQGCQSFFLKNPAVTLEMYKLYPEKYIPNLGYNHVSIDTRVWHVVRYLYKKTVPTKGCFLDFGPGDLAILDGMKQLGWETIGVDFSSKTLSRLREKGHLAFDSENFFSEQPTNSVHFFRMSHSLEHLERPRETLEQLFKCLKSEGVAHIALPNPLSIQAKIFGRSWFGLDCPRHLALWGPKEISKVLKKIGFSKIEVLHEPAPKDWARSLGTFLQSCGILTHWDLSKFSENRFLLRIFKFPSRFFSYFGFGDRIHLIVFKK